MNQGFHPIEQSTLGDKVAVEVLRLIASGELAPGDRLPSERQLTEMLEVSRVSVRAGLQQLKAKGLLTAVRGGGTRIAEPEVVGDPALTALAQIDRGSLLELLEIRTLLECWAVSKAAARATTEDIAALRRLIDQMNTPNGIEHVETDTDKAQADVAFHLEIARISGSPVYRHLLGVIHGTLVEMLSYHRYELFGGVEEDEAVTAQHHAIADALEAQDPKRAEQAMKAHLSWVRSMYQRSGIVA